MELLFYASYSYSFSTVWYFYVCDVYLARLMISSTTPYKLAEIIRDTWPNLYRPVKKDYNKKGNKTNQ